MRRGRGSASFEPMPGCQYRVYRQDIECDTRGPHAGGMIVVGGVDAYVEGDHGPTELRVIEADGRAWVARVTPFVAFRIDEVTQPEASRF